MTETGRVIKFSQNPLNFASSAQASSSIQATTTAVNIGTSAAASGATTAATGAAGAAGASAGAGAFFATKAGIILISIVGTVVVATAVVVPVVVTQTGNDEPAVTDVISSITEINDIPTTVLDNDVIKTTIINKPVVPTTILETSASSPGGGTGGGGTGEGTGGEGTDPENPGTDPENPGTGGGGSTKEKVQYFSKMISLTQNNFLEYSRTPTYVDRNIPTEFGYEVVNEKISYGGDNSAINDKYDDILAENNKLIASSSTYDEIGSDGKLYLNGKDTGRKLYKHIFSDGLYGSNVSADEKAIKKVIKLNPVSSTNYITGLYAPPGEIITIEISATDLANIGGSLTFLIGFYTHNNVISINNAAIGIKRVPNLSNSLTITKTTGYIGSLLEVQYIFLILLKVGNSQ